MTQRVPPERSQYSMLGGMWLVLHDEDQKFALWVSSLSGKEEVYWNDRLVSTKRKISLSSEHRIVANGVEYTLAIVTRELRSGKFDCTLAKFGKVVSQVETEYLQRKSITARVIAIALSAGLTLMWLSEQMPLWAFTLGVLFIISSGTAWSTYGKGFVFRELQRAPTSDA